MAAKKEEEFDLEAALARIEEITALLSSSETSLKDSVKLYQEGRYGAYQEMSGKSGRCGETASDFKS